MKRPIIIDLTIDNEPIHRYRAFHVPRKGETISSYSGRLRGEFKVISVDHLLGELSSSVDMETSYCQLVTVEVQKVPQADEHCA